MLGTVQKIDGKHMTVELDHNDDSKKSKLVTFNTANYSSFDHGYATTIHKSQGATIDHAFVLKSKTMDKHLNYVAMTRHKEAMRVYSQSRNMKNRTSKVQPKYDQDYELEL